MAEASRARPAVELAVSIAADRVLYIQEAISRLRAANLTRLVSIVSPVDTPSRYGAAGSSDHSRTPVLTTR
jgi:hypothetical protein